MSGWGHSASILCGKKVEGCPEAVAPGYIARGQDLRALAVTTCREGLLVWSGR